MLLKKEDKVVLKKKMDNFDDVGSIYFVTYVSEDDSIIDFLSENKTHRICMSSNQVDEYFEKYEEPIEEETFTITSDYIDEIMEEADVVVLPAMFDKCTVVAVQLPNGFVIVESSSCVDPRNYDENMGVEICMDKIRRKVWELEGYKLQTDLYEMGYDLYEEYDCENCDLCDVCDDYNK